MPVKVGDTAPEFELLGKRWGKDAPTYRLSDALAKGGVVLQFFPLPFTGTCETQMCAVRDHVEDYRSAGVDGLRRHGALPHAAEGLGRRAPFRGRDPRRLRPRDLAPPYARLYDDPLPAGLRLAAKRGVVAISSDGTVRFVWISEIPGVAPIRTW